MKRRAFLSSRSSFRLTPLCTIQSVDYQNLKTPKKKKKKKKKTRHGGVGRYKRQRGCCWFTWLKSHWNRYSCSFPPPPPPPPTILFSLDTQHVFQNCVVCVGVWILFSNSTRPSDETTKAQATKKREGDTITIQPILIIIIIICRVFFASHAERADILFYLWTLLRTFFCFCFVYP